MRRALHLRNGSRGQRARTEAGHRDFGLWAGRNSGGARQRENRGALIGGTVYEKVQEFPEPWIAGPIAVFLAAAGARVILSSRAGGSGENTQAG